MNVDFSQFRNREIESLLNDAATLCRDLSFKSVSPAALFIVLQQRFPNQLHDFLQKGGVDESGFYSQIGALLNSGERLPSPTGTISVAPCLIDVLNLTLRIEELLPESLTLLPPNPQTGQAEYNQAALVTALLTTRDFTPSGEERHSLASIAGSMALTTEKMQNILNGSATPAEPPQGNTGTTASTNTNTPPDAPITPDDSDQPHTRRDTASAEATDCPTVRQFCTNLIERAREGFIEPAIGRDEEIMRVLQILTRKTKSNPVLVGEPGTGKTAIVEGLAHRLLEGNVPEELSRLKLYQLDPGTLESIGNGEEIMRKMVDELKQDESIVLFIDEIHTLVGANSGSDNPIANLLKPEMARGTIKILGATTLDEYTSHIEKDKAFERRFQKVLVDEPDIDSAIIILKGIKNRFEQHHHITIPDHVVECAVKLSHRYITDRRLPDKAIDLVDEAASCLRIEHRGDTLTDKDIMDVVTKWTGIPLQNMTEDDTERLQHIEECLHQSVIGQDKAITAVANAIRRNRLGLSDASRPIGSFLFLGTTGVGKTELCKALAEFLFHSRDMIVRIDMSEYQQEHSVARLFGAPPGYVGYDQGGQLTEAVRRKPYSIVLFDEIEKAHPKIFETLLQVLDDGRMTDGQGRVVDFKNTLIVMTSNMGQDVIMRNLSGVEPDDGTIERTSEAVISQLRQRVAPEFINRIDNIVMFLPLTRDNIRAIAELQINKTISQLAENSIILVADPSVTEFIADKGYQPEYGGRPVKRAINTYIKDAISQALVNGDIEKSKRVKCSVVDGNVTFSNTDAD